MIVNGDIAPKIGSLVFELYLSIIFAEYGGARITYLVFGKGAPVDNVDLLFFWDGILTKGKPNKKEREEAFAREGT